MLFGFFKKHAERLRYYDTVTGMSKIIRRYFVMNSFDGALTIFGLLLGSFAAGVTNSLLILKIGLSTAIAIGFSGLTGALMTERAERLREVKSMELALHRKLDNTDYKKAYEFATLLTAFVDGVSPVLAATVLLSPFIFVPLPDAYYYAFGLALIVFFALGAFLGKIAKEHILKTGLKFLLAGLACMVVILLLENIQTGV
jgi:predicted membrane protein (TIGR00267 family)